MTPRLLFTPRLNPYQPILCAAKVPLPPTPISYHFEHSVMSHF